jgi:hypothetical protein
MPETILVSLVTVTKCAILDIVEKVWEAAMQAFSLPWSGYCKYLHYFLALNLALPLFWATRNNTDVWKDCHWCSPIEGLWRIHFHSRLQDALSYLSVQQNIQLVLSFSEPIPSGKIQTVAHGVSGQWYYRHLSSSSGI